MGSISGLLDMGKRSLLANQTALLVTSHNIANANTPGFSRQEAVFSEATPENSTPGQVGRGVTVSQIKRVYDRFIDFQIKTESQNFGRLDVEKDALMRIEVVFNDDENAGINNAIDEFFNAWHDLSNNPQGTAERSNLLAKGEDLASTFNKAYSDLDQIKTDLNRELSGEIDEINDLASRIATLNEKISKAEISGMEANDYRDERGELLRKLAEKIDITYFEDSLGQLTVMVGSRSPIVEARTARSLSVINNPDDPGMYDIGFDDGSGTITDITDNITNGSLKGLMNQRDSTIPDIKDELNTLAAAIIDEINTQHQLGYALDGSTGNDFFTPYSSSDNAASEFAVDLSDINLIAASASSTGLPGDNGNALLLAELQNSQVLDGGTSTFNSFYRSIVEEVGVETRNAQGDFDIQNMVQNQLDNLREDSSGVSLDEEMANLIKYQQAFMASAKLITLSDELMNTLIQMKA